MKRLTGDEFQHEVSNCLYDSLSYFMTSLKHRGAELRLHAIDWAETQIQKNTKWATTTFEQFLATITDMDNYGMASLLEYIRHIQNKRVYATSIDLSMISLCLQIKLSFYSLHTAYGGSLSV